MSEIPYLVRMQHRPTPQPRRDVMLYRMVGDKTAQIPVFDKRQLNQNEEEITDRTGVVKKSEEIIGVVSEMKPSSGLEPDINDVHSDIHIEVPVEPTRDVFTIFKQRDHALSGEREEGEEEEGKERKEKRKEQKKREEEGKEDPEKEEREEEELSEVGEGEELQKETPIPPKRPDLPEYTDRALQRVLPPEIYKRIPRKREQEYEIKISSYYMANRKLYTQYLKHLFRSFSEEFLSEKTAVSCDMQGVSSSKMELLIHQRIVREYLNVFTPYRGLLLYHGLGSGKTCTSIAIAEAAKTHKRIFVMTPASLKMNFFSELKKCGDDYYRKNQYWEFVSIEGKPENIQFLAKALSLQEEFIQRNKGAWLMDVRKKEPNYSTLTPNEQHSLDEQLNEMIRAKYVDINYNGLTAKKFKEFVGQYKNKKTGNPFDNSVVLIDEAHNLVSRIVNSMNKPNSISGKIYHYLQSAQDVRIVFMSGTPIINYPNELAVLFNMLRGHIKTWKFTITASDERLTAEKIVNIFRDANFSVYDYVDYTNNILSITRNPFGFVNTNKSSRSVRRGGGGTKTEEEEPHTEVVFEDPAPIKESDNDETDREKKTNHKTTAKKQPKKQAKSTRKNRSNIIPLPKYKIHKGALELPPEEEVDLPDAVKEQIAFEIHQLRNEVGEDRYHSGGATVIDTQYNGVTLGEQGNLNDLDFEKEVKRILKQNGISYAERITVEINKCLPDDYDEFMQKFVNKEAVNADDQVLVRPDVLTKRILGLTSYFRSAQESLLPQVILSRNKFNPMYHIEEIEMSDHQFTDYAKEREKELAKEMNRGKKKDDDVMKTTGTYRTFTRAKCNFSFPPEIERPMPPKMNDKTDVGEDVLDNIVDNNEADMVVDDDTAVANPVSDVYASQIQSALKSLKEREREFLTPEGLSRYSPKFARILQNVSNPENSGLHLIYSAFRTLEGVGILKLVLEANGFAEFKLKKDGDVWSIDQTLDEQFAIKPRFVLYTGTETAEEKEIIRNIYNSNWALVPSNIVDELKKLHENNFMGEIIKVMMITASGAEGINLENTRFVHIVEPYWHMVRIEQVIGRARRICSHKNLPESLRTIQVFLYLSRFSKKQKTDEKTGKAGIMTKDISRLNKKEPITTDEYLFEIAYQKDRLIKQLLKAVKQSSIDCDVYDNSKEGLKCHTYGQTTTNEFGIFPDYNKDLTVVEGADVRKTAFKVIAVQVDGVKYAYNTANEDLYDYDMYKQSGKPVVRNNFRQMKRENPRLELVKLGKK